MRALTLTLVAFALPLFATADVTNSTPAVRKTFTRAELQAMQDEYIRKQGGLVNRPTTGKRVYIVNLQSYVPDDVVAEWAEDIRETARFAVEVVKAKRSEDVALDREKTGAVVYLNWNDADPGLLVAPEDAWAKVNVKSLKKDSPKALVMKSRFVKECWRALAYALGAANSFQQPCIMHDVFAAKDLDANAVAVPSPEPLQKMLSTASAIGIGSTTRVLYSKACEEGWAPSPANPIQKDIWEKAKSKNDPTGRWKKDFEKK